MLFQWRWYYNVPGLALWVVLLLLAVVPRHNRHLQAWLILMVPLLAAAFSFTLRLLFPDSSGSDGFGQFITALAIAWTCVWLMGKWLGEGRRLRTALGAGAVMFAIGAVAYVGYLGFWVSSDVTWPLVGIWAVCSVPLVGATACTGYCCRETCDPLKLLLWPLLWIPVIGAVCIMLFVAGIVAVEAGDVFSAPELLVMFVVQGLVATPFVAAALYVLNLPIALLCTFSPDYRARFSRLFCGSDGGNLPSGFVGDLAREGFGTSPFRSPMQEDRG